MFHTAMNKGEHVKLGPSLLEEAKHFDSCLAYCMAGRGIQTGQLKAMVCR